MVCLHREQQQAAVQQHEALSGTKELEVSEAAWRCCHFAAVQQTHLHAAALELLCYLHWLLAASTPQILPVLLLLFLLVLLLRAIEHNARRQASGCCCWTCCFVSAVSLYVFLALHLFAW